MLSFTLKCVFRFTDHRTGLVVDTKSVTAADRAAAIEQAWPIARDRPKLVLISAALICDVTTKIVWMMQQPMKPEDVESFTKRPAY